MRGAARRVVKKDTARSSNNGLKRLYIDESADRIRAYTGGLFLHRRRELLS